MEKTLKVGMGQILVEGGEPIRNLRRAVEMSKQAADNDCDLVLLPECMDLGWTHPSAKTEAKPIPGEYSDKLCEVANELSIFICAGLCEKSEGVVYNSAILINDQGEIILKYRKINVLKVGLEFYDIGNSLTVVDTIFGKIGVNICSDNYIDSLTIGHTLARMGAQIILSPSSWTVEYSVDETEDPYKEKWLKPYSTLAQLYDLVMIGVTSVGYIVGGPYEGKKSVGCSIAVNKEGVICRGPYLEFAGELVVTEIKVPFRPQKGTEISDLLKDKGYIFT